MVNTKCELLVIGGGYWGTGVTLEAKERGIDVLTLDDRDKESGSRNASAVCDPKAYDSDIFKKYFPSNWTQKDLEKSFEWICSKGAYETQEYFWNDYQKSSPRLMERKIYYLPSPEFLTDQIDPLNGKVLSISKLAFTNDFWTITYSTPTKEIKTIVCKNLVIAAGYRTDEVISLITPDWMLGVGKLYGRGLNVKGTPTMDLPVSVMIKPYVKHTVRIWKNGIYKVGDTCEKVPNENKLANLKDVGARVLSNMEILEVTAGWRPTLPKFTVKKLANNLVAATGGHRLGLGVTGIVANKVLEELGYV